MDEARTRENVEQVQAKIVRSAQRVGRSPSDVTLVAVSKTHSLEKVAAVYAAGLRHFGENRVEEASGKIVEAKAGALPDDVIWHMIGHVQSRQTNDVAPVFDWVHSIDRWKIARRLNDHLAETGRTLEGLIEVNVSGEVSKYGYDCSAWPDGGDLATSQFEVLAADIELICALPHLRLRGLMTLAPYTSDPETVRPIFQSTRLLRDALRERFPGLPWDQLSMGMSADYEVAVEEGATMVRVGTAIFGERETS